MRPVKTEWWGAGVVICLQRGADLHMAQLMPLPLTVSCFSKIQIAFTFLVPLNVCVCVCVVPGQPRTTWMKNIHEDLPSLYPGIHEARDLVQNQPLWRLMSSHNTTHS